MIKRGVLLVAFIIACEIAFWVFVAAGLACRYLLRRKRLGAALLIATPLIDVVLLAAALWDIRSGAAATAAHGIAAIYIGASIAFGHSMIAWADAQFHHRFSGGPAPAKPPKHGTAHAARERKGWLRHLLAYAIGGAILLGMTALAGDAAETDALIKVLRTWTLVLAIDFAISFSYTLWPRKPKAQTKAS
ncbi:Uncharacterized membrane protein YmcC [Paenibacillus sp. P22]|nr:Uncharacterized membrane protein YmcC [Paenibacillus sp. P22]